jgi:hypothetical protein
MKQLHDRKAAATKWAMRPKLVTDMKIPGKEASNKMAKAIEILNKKGYEADLGPIYTLTTHKLIPCIFFGEMLSEMSFRDYPKGFKAVMLDRRFYIYPPCLLDPSDAMQSKFTDATTQLVKWAEKLSQAADLMFEINVPEDGAPEELADDIDWDLCLRHYDIDEDNEQEDYITSLIYPMVVAPNAVKKARRRLKEFAKGRVSRYHFLAQNKNNNKNKTTLRGKVLRRAL